MNTVNKRRFISLTILCGILIGIYDHLLLTDYSYEPCLGCSIDSYMETQKTNLIVMVALGFGYLLMAIPALKFLLADGVFDDKR